jgi:6-phosphofructokinase 1
MMHLAVYAGRTQAYKDMQFVYAPKTIDNDAPGVDFTFGHFTAAERAAEYIYNVLEDARTTNSWFIIGCMGRNAGFLPMLAAFGGEASGVIIPEQVGRGRVDVDSLARSVIDLIDRRQKEGKHYGVVVVAEGLTDLLPEDQRPQKTDAHGHVDLNAAKFEEILAIRVNALAPSLKVKTGRTGYEGRSASPIVFDQFYASALGFGAFSLLAQGMTGVMPVIRDGYRLRADGFDRLVDGRALGCGRLVPRVRRVKRGSFFEEVALTSMAPTSRAAFEAVWRRESRGG